MKQIGSTIIEDGIVTTYDKKRITVRAVIINEKKQIYMLYSKLFNDYTFPGGGVKEGEDLREALQRELAEELGVDDFNIIEEIGYTIEIRYGISGSDTVYEQASYYYDCQIVKQSKPRFMQRELEQGLEGRWVEIQDVIDHNDRIWQDDMHQVKGLKTVLLREKAVLNHLKEIL